MTQGTEMFQELIYIHDTILLTYHVMLVLSSD